MSGLYQLTMRLNYHLKARYHRGYRVHSPFVYQLITDVFEGMYDYYAFEEIEVVRRSVKRSVRRGFLPRKYAQMLFRLINFFQPSYLVELGVGDGVTGQYLMAASRKAKNVWTDTVESPEALDSFFSKLSPDLAILYASLTPEELKWAVDACLKVHRDNTVLVVFGIRNDRAKRALWRELLNRPEVSLTMELNRMGLVFFRPELQHRNYLYRY